LSILGTWIIISDENESRFAIDPPEANLIQTKRVAMCLSQNTADIIINCRLYDGVVLNIMEDIILQFDEGNFKPLNQSEILYV